jgi:hypothetical protein
LKALEAERAAWADAFPSFAIGEPDDPPDEADLYRPTYQACPPRLLAAFQNQQRRWFGGLGSTPEDDLNVEADRAWQRLVARLCLDWWPPEYYPDYGFAGSDPAAGFIGFHPAKRFVAACLVWGPRLVPEDLISKYALYVEAFPIDPQRADGHRSAIEWRARYERLVQRLEEAVRDQTTITNDVVNDAIRDTAYAGFKAANRIQWRDEPSYARFVRVFPGMTRDDWRRAEPTVIGELNRVYGDQPLRRTVQRLVAEGMSTRAIAGLLGVSRPTVSRLSTGN